MMRLCEKNESTQIGEKKSGSGLQQNVEKEEATTKKGWARTQTYKRRCNNNYIP